MRAVDTFVDLSNTIVEGMETYPGLPTPQLGTVLSRADSRGRYAPGVEFHIGSISLCTRRPRQAAVDDAGNAGFMKARAICRQLGTLVERLLIAKSAIFSWVSRAAAAAAMVVGSGCQSKVEREGAAVVVAGDFMRSYKGRVVVAGTGKEASAQLTLINADGANGCPYARVVLSVPEGFIPGARGVPQYGCTEQQTPPQSYGGRIAGVDCSVVVLPSEKAFDLDVFC